MKLAIGVNWQGKVDFKTLIERAKAADAAGVHSLWVAEAWGRDAFTLLTLMAEHTRRIQLATGIVNVFSRSPAALAQHFATLDELSEGRAIIGLGTSGPLVIEHFHGVPFRQPLARLRETIEIINLLLAGKPLIHRGKVFNLERGFTLRFTPFRSKIPIYLASLKARSVELAARHADGWLPVMIPLSRLGRAVEEFREFGRRAGRSPEQLSVKSPGVVTVTREPERARQAYAANLAFYIARMGTFYSEQLATWGFGDAVQQVRDAWAKGGSKAGAAAVPRQLLDELAYFGEVEGARERLRAQEAAGVDLHNVEVEADGDWRSFARTLEALAK